jgi:hypothetical protein
MPEEPNKRKSLQERWKQTRENMQDNKMVQWARDNRVPIGVGVGSLAFGYLLRGKTVHMAPAFNNTVAPVIAPVFTNTVNNGGHMRKIVECIETGELWKSVTAAAEAHGQNVSTMSKHINNYPGYDDIKGLHFVIEAVTAG